MLALDWSDEYSVDYGVIDAEHKCLFAIANRVFEISDPVAGREEIIAIVKSLFQYMEDHFQHEEELMMQCEYPALIEHAALHRRITAGMTRAVREIKDIQHFAAELRFMMVEWVLTHMIQEDKQIGEYLRSRAHELV
jgi:hemerythrin